MAASETDLGNIQTLLQKVLDEVQSLRKEISVLKTNPRKISNQPPILWFDKLPPIRELAKGEYPQKNSSSDPHNKVCFGPTDIVDLYERMGIPFEMKDISDWNDTYVDRDNLYFIEIVQVHVNVEDIFCGCNHHALQMVRERKMAMVFWFPHEGFGMTSLRDVVNDNPWMTRLVKKIVDYDLSGGVHYFIYGDFNVQKNFDRWKRANPEIEFEFKKCFGIDFFHEHYFKQYVSRTCWRFNPSHNFDKYKSVESFGDYHCSKHRDAYIEFEDLPEQVKKSKQDTNKPGWPRLQWADEYRDIRLDEVMADVPPATEKERDLICLNARVRPHRPVIVSELFRLGYDNNNSYISFLARDENPEEHPELYWKFKYFYTKSEYREDTIEDWVSNEWTAPNTIMEFETQREFFYKFWHKNDIISIDINTDSVTKDDRRITLDHYRKSFFALVSETLFGLDDSNCLQITEKIYKCFAYRIPFMVVGSPGTLEHLRDMGYETFPEMFDETYDSILNPKKRMSHIIRNLERWKTLTHAEKFRLYESVRPKLYRNYEHFKNCSSVRIAEHRNIFNELRLYD